LITRLWRGWTSGENADAYERFLLRDLFPAMRKIPGFRGADVLRRDENGEVGFVTLTRFEALDDIRAFAGEDYETPVLDRPRGRCCRVTSREPTITQLRGSKPEPTRRAG
jgi:antibiotic biosynthesis monooxygenase (ABM) superfamily enzyme